jgi:hypothetical protein
MCQPSDQKGIDLSAAAVQSMLHYEMGIIYLSISDLVYSSSGRSLVVMMSALHCINAKRRRSGVRSSPPVRIIEFFCILFAHLMCCKEREP